MRLGSSRDAPRAGNEETEATWVTRRTCKRWYRATEALSNDASDRIPRFRRLQAADLHSSESSYFACGSSNTTNEKALAQSLKCSLSCW